MKQVACLLCVTTIDCSRSSSTMLTLRPLSVIADCQICVKSSGTRERHTVSTSLPLFADPTFSTINTIKVNPAFPNISSAFHPKLQNINLTAEYRMRMKNQLLSSQESIQSSTVHDQACNVLFSNQKLDSSTKQLSLDKSRKMPNNKTEDI